MDLNVLKYVVEVVETGSISKAAANLFMSQSTLSAQISAMEKELGRAVFQRTNRGFSSPDMARRCTITPRRWCVSVTLSRRSFLRM